MHRDVHLLPGQGRCPYCGMALRPESARFGSIRQLLSNPLPLTVMGAIIVVPMIAALMTH